MEKQFKFKYKVKTFKINISLPKVYDGHFAWMHNEDLSLENFSELTLYVDHFSCAQMDEILIYRQLMMEAGFSSRYSWTGENEHYYKNNFGMWKWTKGKQQEILIK